MDIYIWYTLLSAVVGGVMGARARLGEVLFPLYFCIFLHFSGGALAVGKISRCIHLVKLCYASFLHELLFAELIFYVLKFIREVYLLWLLICIFLIPLGSFFT